MKKLLWILLFFAHHANGQFIVRPFIWQNDFRISYDNGGYNFGSGSSSWVPALDLEYRLTKKLDSASSFSQLTFRPSLGLITGISYLDNTNTERGSSQNSDYLFCSYKSSFIAVPLIAKYYMQFGVLSDKLKAGFGVGIMTLINTHSELHEEANIITKIGSVTDVKLAQDTRDITPWAVPLTIAFCIELSAEYGRFYFGFRVWQSGKDEYVNSIKNNWGVPNDHSIYITAYDNYPKMTFSGGGLLFGFRINPLKKY